MWLLRSRRLTFRTYVARRLALLNVLYEHAAAQQSNYIQLTVSTGLPLEDLRKRLRLDLHQVAFMCRTLSTLGYLEWMPSGTAVDITPQGIVYYEDQLQRRKDARRKLGDWLVTIAAGIISGTGGYFLGKALDQ